MRFLGRMLPFINRIVETAAEAADKLEAVMVKEITDEFAVFPSSHVREEIDKILDELFNNPNSPGSYLAEMDSCLEIPVDVDNLIIGKLTVFGISYALNCEDLEDLRQTIMQTLIDIVSQTFPLDVSGEKLSILFSVERDRLAIILRTYFQSVETKMVKHEKSYGSRYAEPIEISWNITPSPAFG